MYICVYCLKQTRTVTSTPRLTDQPSVIKWLWLTHLVSLVDYLSLLHERLTIQVYSCLFTQKNMITCVCSKELLRSLLININILHLRLPHNFLSFMLSNKDFTLMWKRSVIHKITANFVLGSRIKHYNMAIYIHFQGRTMK